MKKFLFFILLFSSVTLLSQQDRFLIGVDWINPTSPAPATNYQLLSNAYWDTLKSFGVNFGALNIGRNQSNGLTKINSELTQAASRDIRIFLWTGQLYPARGRRWMYQVENNWDFSSHVSGTSLRINDAEPHWSQVNVNNNAPNFLQLTIGDQVGYVASGLINDSEIPDGTNYYTKVRIRKTSPDITHTAVIKVIIFNKNNGNVIGERILYADDGELSYNVWCEKQLFNFYKAATLPYNYIEGANNRILNDPVGLTGVEDYVSTTQTYTPYEIKIEWFGNVSCDIDYVVIDDVASHNLHNGVYDNIFNQIVTEFGSHQGLGKIKIMDEPGKDELLPIRRMKSKLDEYLAVNGNQSKSALCFHVPPYNGNTNWPIAQRFHSQSKLDIAISDIYPIYERIPTPSEPNYYESLQNILNTDLTYWLNDEINKTNLFNNTFWFTPQTHSWLGGQREPSVYEIKAMTNLGICYGAKGIHYFMFSKPPEGNTLLDDNNINNPIPRYKDAYQFDKWNLLKQQNQKLAAIGNELLSLTWQNAFYINNGNQPTGTYISGVQSIGDNLISTYVQLGIFKKTVDPNNDNLEYFFIVNRRTLATDQRDIAITINKSNTIYNNWKVNEVGTSNTWTVSNTGSFTANYQPGEGKLFKMEPVMIAGGTLAYNENIPQTTTINSGVTLTVLPGVNLSFTNGASLTINGTLIANGSNVNRIIFNRSGPNGLWGSLKFDGAGASSSILNNVEVYNSANIQILNDANIIVENSKIQDCTQGIYVYNASPQILNNQILHPSQHGIYIDASGKTPLILNNTITKISSNPNYKHQEGIIMYNGTIGYIAHNDISGFDHGIYVGGGSNAKFTNYNWQNFYPNNRFTGNRYGIMVGWGSYLAAGVGWAQYWNNSIWNNDYYNIYVYQSSTAYAQYNYWGVRSSKQYFDWNSSLTATPVLSNDPWDSYQNAVKAFTPADVAIPEVQLITTNAKSSPAIKSSFNKVHAPELNNDLGDAKDEDDFMNGIRLEQEGKIDEAIEQLKKVVKYKKYGLYALTELAGIKERYGKESIQPFFEGLLKDPNIETKSRIKKFLAGFYINNDEDDRAIALFDELKNDKISKKDNFEGLYEKFNLMLHKKKDSESAKNILGELKSKFADDEDAMIHIATAELLLSGNNNFALGKKQNEITVPNDNEVVKEYALFNNYPNPFNPVTTINYQLPKSGSVTLKIFDILGNEVRTLVNEQKEKGKYTVQFDASSLASGMYVYQLRLNDYISNKKMLLLK